MCFPPSFKALFTQQPIAYSLAALLCNKHITCGAHGARKIYYYVYIIAWLHFRSYLIVGRLHSNHQLIIIILTINIGWHLGWPIRCQGWPWPPIYKRPWWRQQGRAAATVHTQSHFWPCGYSMHSAPDALIHHLPIAQDPAMGCPAIIVFYRFWLWSDA